MNSLNFQNVNSTNFIYAPLSDRLRSQDSGNRRLTNKRRTKQLKPCARNSVDLSSDNENVEPGSGEHSVLNAVMLIDKWALSTTRQQWDSLDNWPIILE